jgi:hypothetical protein
MGTLAPFGSRHAAKIIRKALGLEVSREPLPAYAWPGGYDLAYITSDNAILCADCANKELVRIASEIKSPERRDQYRVDRR